MNTLPRIVRVLLFLTLALVAVPVHAQAIWSGGDGNWTDANWTGGSGPGGQPGAGQDVALPASTNTLSATTPLATGVGNFGALNIQGGTLVVGPQGTLAFNGNVHLGDGANSSGTLVLQGELNVLGELDVGYGAGDGAGNALGILAIDGNAKLRVSGNLDTWWDDGAQMSITGGDADIEVGGTFFLGTATTLSANINSDTFSTVFVTGNVNFPGGNGTLKVNFVDGYQPSVGTSWLLFDTPARGGEIPIVDVPATPKGTLLSVNYAQGGEYGEVVTLDYTSTLNLRVDPETGAASIENPAAGAAPLDIDGYIIRSASQSLNATGFQGLSQPGWLPGLPPSQSSGLLSETNFDGSLVVNSGASHPLGTLFQPAGAQDLTFELHLATGGTIAGTVEYAGGGVIGDFNGNGVLDSGDIDDLTLQSATGNNPPAYDLNADTLVNDGDVQVWVKNLFKSWIGDANLNREFNSTDLVDVLAAGTYEVEVEAVWSTGDFNADGRTNSSDLVAALADGGYEQGPPPALAAVPEPAGWLLLLAALPCLTATARRRPK